MERLIRELVRSGWPRRGQRGGRELLFVTSEGDVPCRGNRRNDLGHGLRIVPVR